MKLDKLIKHREQDKEYQREKRKNGVVNKTKEYSDWRKKNPKGARAHFLTNYRIKKGKIVRGKCELKDGTCSLGLIQAHHEDYEKPLVIRWLCASHHKKVDLGLIKLINKNERNKRS